MEWMQEIHSEVQSNKAVKDICTSQLEEQKREEEVVVLEVETILKPQQCNYLSKCQHGGNAIDFGDLTYGSNRMGALASSTRALSGGGRPSSINCDVWILLPLQQHQMHTDFGDSTVA